MNKKILVTAGPVWVPIDSVRVMTNRFTGRTGTHIASGLAKKGFEVTLLLGPSQYLPEEIRGMKVVRFKYFDELRESVKQCIVSGDYAAVVHTSAVADYSPVEVYDGKIKSKQDELVLKLKPTPKIIKDMREYSKDIKLIQFKLEVGLKKDDLVDVAYKSLLGNDSDYVIANDLEDLQEGQYKGILINRNKECKKIDSKDDLVNKISEIL